MATILFIVFAGLAIGSAIAMVSQRNPLYSAISLIGVFIALASIYVTLAAPFIAAVQVIVYAGAIMVLVIFVIMLLNVEQEEPRRRRLRFLVPAAIGMAAILIAETAFILYSVQTPPGQMPRGIWPGGVCTEYRMKAVSAINMAAMPMAAGTRNRKRLRRGSSCSTFSNMMTKITSTMMAPA